MSQPVQYRELVTSPIHRSPQVDATRIIQPSAQYLERTCLQAHFGRLMTASGYDGLPPSSPSCINAHVANVSRELGID
ncbi:hypothetical protein N7466_001486 [Penicillium verhagenii]|uniref:uncharacterized protein n=1 Tax=Penicillium verhagenii TaxID=1562060 RepID=UPI002545AC68|nr:uncharacterized protein N7466_001486 [Penicillium verhagenii]KAJ5938352.1 hypothetical protein N7466_001486 [Penicillium verhagenii]